MDAVLDGEMQNFKAKGGAYTRENFFAKDPDVLKIVEDLTDEDIYRLNRGGHDPYKVYAAYHKAVNSSGAPTVILALTTKVMELVQERLIIQHIKLKNYHWITSKHSEINLIYLLQMKILNKYHM